MWSDIALWLSVAVAVILAVGMVTGQHYHPVNGPRMLRLGMVMLLLVGVSALTACSGPLTGDVGCTLYQAQRGDMPRPIGSGPLAECSPPTRG